MYDYVTKELPDLVNSMFPVNPEKKSITGHSMGGHGALICHLKNPGTYSSASAFAPICNPTQVHKTHSQGNPTGLSRQEGRIYGCRPPALSIGDLNF